MYKLWSGGPDLLHNLEYVDLLLCVDHVDETTDRTKQSTALYTIPKMKKDYVVHINLSYTVF